MTTVFTPDPLRKSVEAASEGKCTVLYTSKGLPTFMTIIPAFKCEDLADDIGTGLHPAFMIGGNPVGEMLIGTYLSIVHDGQALSLPYQNPRTRINYDDSIKACRACGPDFHMMTNWEWAAIGLWCMKHGLPRGNTDYGKSHSHPEEKGMVCEHGKTLTGSGPASWRHDGTFSGIADLVGNVWEHQNGLKFVGGKIFMPPDNDFSMPEKEWPDTGVRIDGDDEIQFSNEITRRGWPAQSFKDVSVKEDCEAALALRQALLTPCSLSKQDDQCEPLGYMWANNEVNTQRLPVRGGYWCYGASAGVAALYLFYARSNVDTNIGFRLAYISSVKSV